jgi:hypothetical protein
MKTSEDRLSVKHFFNPPAEYRPMPFWGLNDLLEDRQLRWQIQEMKRQGWGGFFMHPRYGMETPYLTREFMDRIRTCVKEARRMGLQAWIYDEHPFPAGCAGGLVGAASPDFRHKALVMRIHNRLTPIAEGVAYFAATLKNGIPVRLKQIANPEGYRGKERNFLHFYQWTEAIQPSTHLGIPDCFIHGFPYTDTLNPQAIKRFIGFTYEGYRRAVGAEFGKTLKGVFSDAPSYQWHYSTPRPSVPWTPELPKYFRKRCGYDILPRLPSLFLDVGDYARIRHDFWRTVNERFLECCTKQLYEWCSRHNLLYTAHYWGEETLHWQIPWTGDVMTHFAHQHVVAIDHILRNIEDPVGVKQATSVAAQLGKPRTISETYALCGHNLTYEERKWIGDWLYALGVNVLVPYIAAYSFRGRRKRDEPPSEFIQQPYWEYEHLINNYYGRLSYVLSRGKQVVDVLVLQPLASAWTLYKASSGMPAAYRPHSEPYEGAGATLLEFSQQFLELCNVLLQAHRDFHIGNEALLAEHAYVEDNQLRVGEMSYRAVIVPPSLNWRRTTVRLLQKFCARGGILIAQKPLPTLIDGRSAKGSVLPKDATVVAHRPEGVVRKLEERLQRDIQIDGARELLYHHRRSGDKDIYFLANTSLENAYPNTHVRIPGEGILELWDALTGKRYALLPEQNQARQEGISIQLDFAPVSSYLLVRQPEHKDQLKVFRRRPSAVDDSVPLAGKWKVRRVDPNALTLDYCEVQIGKRGWTHRMPIWQAHLRVHESGFGSEVGLRFRFDVSQLPRLAHFAIENPERYTVQFNGITLSRKTVGWRWDPSVKLFDITALMRPGENIVELAGRCGIDTEIENCYVIGDFAVMENKGFQIAEEADEISGENLVREGYPFFVGRIVLTQEIDLPDSSRRVYFRLERLDAIIAEVRVNGVVAGHLAWKPYLLEITDHIHPGRIRFEIELCTSLHNLLGPHHNKHGEVRHYVHQHSWTDVVNWTDDYFFVPVGVTGAAIQFVKP